MSLRSGVFTKYEVAFRPGGLRVSSDARSGELCLDAEIRVRMSRGVAGAAFELKLYDLPEPKARTLLESFPVHGGGGLGIPRVRIQLGYLDTEMKCVMDGACEQVLVSIEGDRRVTTVRGRDAACHACATTPCPPLDGVRLPAHELVRHLLAHASLDDEAMIRAPLLGALPRAAPLDGMGIHACSVLGALDDIASLADCEFLLGDGRLAFAHGVVAFAAAPLVLDRSVNLVAFEPFTLAVTEDEGAEGALATVRGFRFKALGDPGLRPGRELALTGVERHHATHGWHLRHLEHRFNATEGYVCAGVGTVALAEVRQARQVDALTERNAAAAASAFAARLKRHDRPLATAGQP